MLSGRWHHPSKTWKTDEHAHKVTSYSCKDEKGQNFSSFTPLACKDHVSYQNGYEADQKGNEEDPHTIEMHHTANGAVQRQWLGGGHSCLCVHQETSVGGKGTDGALAVPQKR